MSILSIDPNHDDFTVLSDKIRDKNGDIYTLGLMGPGLAETAFAFHDGNIRALAEGAKTYLLPKTLSDFREHFHKAHDNTIIALLKDGEMVAQSAILCPNARYPHTGMVDYTAPGSPESLCVLQAVSVAPQFQGRGLMHHMVDAWIDYANRIGRDELLSEIEVHNVGSWKTFMDKGLRIVGKGTDASDGTRVFNAAARTKYALSARLPTLGAHPPPDPAALVMCHLSDTARQIQLLTEGYVGVAVDKARQSLCMAPITALS